MRPCLVAKRFPWAQHNSGATGVSVQKGGDAYMSHAAHIRPIKPREKLDFQLGSGIPRFWNGGDAFKTRFFDAMSLTFPVGERYFISTVRAYGDQITDPHLLQEVKDFTRQEAQHGMVHTAFNAMLEKQGLNVAWTQRFLDRKFKFQLDWWSKAFNLSYTAAAEHMTAMMCTTFMERADIIEPFDHCMLKDAWWLYKPGGVFLPALGYYLSYFKPGFHPWQHTEMGRYQDWLTAFEHTGDPVEASEVFTAKVLAGA